MLFYFHGPSGKGACVQLWYHLYGQGVGTLNVYQQSEGGQAALILSQTGDHGRMWRFTQASLLPREQPYKVRHKSQATAKRSAGMKGREMVVTALHLF